MIFNKRQPILGRYSDTVRKLAQVNERVAPLLDEPISSDMPQHVKDLMMKIRRTVAKQERIVGEMRADRLETDQIVAEGYEKGVFPIDQELAANADENQQELQTFDRKVADDESQWAQEDATETPRRK